MRDELTREQLQDAYAEFHSIAAIAKYYGASPDTIKRRLDKYGIEYSTNRKYHVDHDFFSRDNEFAAYWAGFLAANGCITTNSGGKACYRVSINLALKDKDHLIRFMKDLKSNIPVKELTINKETDPYDTARVLISSKKIVSDLEQIYNIVPRKTFIYNIPKWLEKSPLLRHFYRGWVDGKGSWCVDPHTNKLSYFRTSGPYIFLDGFMRTMQRQCNVDMREIKPGAEENGRCVGSIIYSGETDMRLIAEYLYNNANVYLSWKRDAALRIEC